MTEGELSARFQEWRTDMDIMEASHISERDKMYNRLAALAAPLLAEGVTAAQIRRWLAGASGAPMSTQTWVAQVKPRLEPLAAQEARKDHTH